MREKRMWNFSKIQEKEFETNLERFFMTSEETLKNVLAPSWEPLGGQPPALQVVVLWLC
jgi:hypothetical protein